MGCKATSVYSPHFFQVLLSGWLSCGNLSRSKKTLGLTTTSSTLFINFVDLIIALPVFNEVVRNHSSMVNMYYQRRKDLRTSFYLQCNCTLLPLFLLLDVIQVFVLIKRFIYHILDKTRFHSLNRQQMLLVKAKIIILKFYSKMTSFNHTKTEGSNLPILRLSCQVLPAFYNSFLNIKNNKDLALSDENQGSFPSGLGWPFASTNVALLGFPGYERRHNTDVKHIIGTQMS
ncbi:hypothetical protein EGR_09289 [Echinococcus granulosus]|uniref:Uncharacterized protein n=1 Tax=Echinococcus granulosus TaxID=6210 RepID=W6UBN1_ECHGR|nr:hypothetical protein EGR_09289 [Echinococcus granulosus]EUB55847.1 hypothetical protein EGR_09289 [Echinococcus granulosus]